MNGFNIVPLSACYRMTLAGGTATVYGVSIGGDDAYAYIGTTLLHCRVDGQEMWRCTEFVDGSGEPICDGDIFIDKHGRKYAVRWVPVLNAFRYVPLGPECAMPKKWVSYSQAFSNRQLGVNHGTLRLTDDHLYTFEGGRYWCDLTIGSYE